MSENILRIELGNYKEDLELYGAYQVLLRALIESKFSARSFDDMIIGSSTLAEMASELVVKMDLLGDKIGIGTNGAQRKWLTVKGRGDRAYNTMLRKLIQPTDANKSLLEWFRSMNHSDRVLHLSIIFSPYIIQGAAAELFLADLGVDLKSLTNPSSS
ncbi:hypothetical protein [Deinococcus puniceus]|uniref:hypothetical protein n=1 Tax=Deinococcus puniceus TaxID=1182568 RepID=UPI0012F7E018|nr:hypothetical protein [Deinococcus puniceus]